MGIIHPNTFMYFPPPRKQFNSSVVIYQGISYVIDSTDDLIMENDFIAANRPNKVRIFFLHGNGGDIRTTYDMRMHLLAGIQKHLPRTLQESCEITCVTIDYPTYGGSRGDPSLLGTALLDHQIAELFQELKVGVVGGGGMNIVWSYSMGTRYACPLINSCPQVDFAYMQAPFYSIPISSSHLFAGVCSGIEGHGLCALAEEKNIFLHLAQYDELFPPSISLDLMKPRAKKGYIVQPGANHYWFETQTAAEIGATIMGKEIGEFFLMREGRSVILTTTGATTLLPTETHMFI